MMEENVIKKLVVASNNLDGTFYYLQSIETLNKSGVRYKWTTDFTKAKDFTNRVEDGKFFAETCECLLLTCTLFLAPHTTNEQAG